MKHNNFSPYPYFLHITADIKSIINHRIHFGITKKQELAVLFNLLRKVEFLEYSFHKNPSISNVNFEQSINALVSSDKEIEGILIRVFLQGNQATKWGQIEFKLKP